MSREAKLPYCLEQFRVMPNILRLYASLVEDLSGQDLDRWIPADMD